MKKPYARTFAETKNCGGNLYEYRSENVSTLCQKSRQKITALEGYASCVLLRRHDLSVCREFAQYAAILYADLVEGDLWYVRVCPADWDRGGIDGMRTL